MAVAYRSSGAACLAAAGTHNITVTGVQAGDLIIMGTVTSDLIYVRGLPAVSGLGSHQVRHMHDTNHNGFVDVFWTIATGTSHTFVVTLSASAICETWWAAYSGVDKANPFAGFIEASGRPIQAAQDWGPLTPDVADSMLVAMIGCDANALTTFAWDSPWNERFDVSSASPTFAATLADTLQSGGPSSQAVGGDWNHATNCSGAAFVCALRPDASGVAGPVATGGALSAIASGTTLAPVLPAHATDDILFAFAANNNGQTMSCGTAGWAEAVEFTDANFSCALYWKRAASGAETNPTITWSAAASTSVGHYAMCATVRGAIATGTPYEDLTGNGTPTSSTTPASATVTATGGRSLALHFVGIDDNNAISLPGQGFPEDGQGSVMTDGSDTGGDCRIAIIEQYAAASGDVTGATLLTQAAADFWKVVSLVMLPAASGPTEHFGATATSIVVTPTTAGIRTRFGATATPVVVTPTTAGVRTRFGSTATSIVVTPTTAGSRTTAGASATPIVVTPTAAGFKTTTGATAASVVVTPTTAGFKTTTGATATPIVVTPTTAGARTVFGASATAIVVTPTTNGIRTALGVSATPIVVTPTTDATLTAFGASATPVVVTPTTAGFKTTTGVTVTPIVVTPTTAGDTSQIVFGATATAIVVTPTTAGFKTTTGVSATSIVVTPTTNGVRTRLGASATAIVVTPTTAGIRTRFGASATPIVVTPTTAAVAPTKAGATATSIVVTPTTEAILGAFGISATPIVFTPTTIPIVPAGRDLPGVSASAGGVRGSAATATLVGARGSSQSAGSVGGRGDAELAGVGGGRGSTTSAGAGGERD